MLDVLLPYPVVGVGLAKIVDGRVGRLVQVSVGMVPTLKQKICEN